jgi:hypothetical protein
MSYRPRTTKERFFEIIPGLMFWATVFFIVFSSSSHPARVAVFIVIFDLYWMLRAINSASHILSSYRKFKFFSTLNWLDFVEKLDDLKGYLDFLKEQEKKAVRSVAKYYYSSEQKRINDLIRSGNTGGDYKDYYHIVLYPFVEEEFVVLDTAIQSLAQANYPKERIIVLLASEERAGEKAAETARRLKEKYEGIFFKFFVTVHPDGLPGEIKGKSANASWGVQTILPELEKLSIGIDQVLVSNLDSDTQIHREYLPRLIYEFLTSKNPYRNSYQPVALYHNNVWDSPSFVRVVSIGDSFWQFMESSRPDRLGTFSSHSMTLRALVDVDFWKKDLVNEDGYIFWQCFLRYKGDYSVTPLFISASMDTCLADTYKQTLINQYKQKRRWAYNVEYYPTLMPAIANSEIPFWKLFKRLFPYIEGNYSWSAVPIVISLLGWLPLIFGGDKFADTVVGFNLPILTSTIMTMAMMMLIFSVYVNMVLLPPRPPKYSKWKTVSMYLQWFLVPVIAIVFISLPAIEAQTRLMLGKYMEFWVTPKARKNIT